MPKINLLSKQVAELIAAGEVVERPASVIKELVENSIDAGADKITVEIQHGGITYIRITDNGCGIEAEDVPTAFLRHATSKIKTDDDLNSIATLGFRGEALAAISSVARVEMFTKTPQSDLGTHYSIEGGDETEHSEAGCPDGTTIIIRDIFYNTPARMKFLKKDVSEANAAAAVIDRIALSHPEISFKFIRDGKLTLNTSGDGKTTSVIYSVLGREFSNTLIPVNSETDHITVMGMTCKPVTCRPTRNNQFVFLNGRLVRSGTVTAAAEQAYKNSAMVGKFPGFVLYLTVPFDTVDVNVHPAKTEVRFSDERRIFEAVYTAIKSALSGGDTRPEIKLNTPKFNPFERIKIEEFTQQPISTPKVNSFVREEVSLHKPQVTQQALHSRLPDFANEFNKIAAERETTVVTPKISVEEVIEETPNTAETENQVNIIPAEEEKPEIIIIGQAFSTYIIAQMGNSVFMIDKHAAHERIIFNTLKNKERIETQNLLTPITVNLSRMEYDAVSNNIDILSESGFEIDDFGNSSVLVRGVPVTLVNEDINSLISELAGSLLNNGTTEISKLENLYHTVACKAAIKAGSKTDIIEMKKLAERVLYSHDIMYCPHGRPVAFEIKKRDLEKQFGRIQ